MHQKVTLVDQKVSSHQLKRLHKLKLVHEQPHQRPRSLFVHGTNVGRNSWRSGAERQARKIPWMIPNATAVVVLASTELMYLTSLNCIPVFSSSQNLLFRPIRRHNPI